MNPVTTTDALRDASVRLYHEYQVAAAHFMHHEEITICVATAHHTGRRIVGSNIG